MLSVLPQLTGIALSRHLKIGHSAATAPASLAFWNGLGLRLKVSDRPREAGRRSVVLRDGRDPKVTRDLTDMREVLEKVRTVAENYQRPRRSWRAVVPADQYSFTKFL